MNCVVALRALSSPFLFSLYSFAPLTTQREIGEKEIEWKISGHTKKFVVFYDYKKNKN